MRDLILDILENTDFDPERILDWARRHRGALLVGTALLTALVLLAPGTNSPRDTSPADAVPDETPLFV